MLSSACWSLERSLDSSASRTEISALVTWESRVWESSSAMMVSAHTRSPASICRDERVPEALAVMLTESAGSKVPTSLHAISPIMAVAESPADSAPGFSAEMLT